MYVLVYPDGRTKDFRELVTAETCAMYACAGTPGVFRVLKDGETISTVSWVTTPPPPSAR